jgi:hypothetical protein
MRYFVSSALMHAQLLALGIESELQESLPPCEEEYRYFIVRPQDIPPDVTAFPEPFYLRFTKKRKKR